ncbi:MAG TPA: 3-isopropylmalate dehydratase [Bryobacteraceae bacterium]|nr:3-isopropylmalate dehydratase [Bryobacteraceae bacterium]
MEPNIQGRAYKFGDNINSDVIIPGRYLIYIDPQKLSEHAFEVLGKEFPAKLRGFQILVAGRNFGCGSAREQAATAIIGLGIKAVVACSFARTFFRNAINDGLPIIECPDLYPAVEEGDDLRIDLAASKIFHRDREYSFPMLPDSVRKILELGGLAAYLKTQLTDARA